MKTVLFTASTYSHVVNFHLPYLRAFHELGWQVHVACGGEPMPIADADLVVHLPFQKKMSSPANFQAQRLLRQAMRENSYGLVCTHTSLAAFFTRRAAAHLPLRPPIVNVAHGYLFDDAMPALKKTVLLTAEKLTAPQTDLLLTMNRWDDAIARRCGLGREIRFIPGIGVDFSRFSQVSQQERAALRLGQGFSGEEFVLLYAAEFSKRKNQAFLIRALGSLPGRVHLVLPGRGALLEECKALAAAVGVANRVHFPGQVAQMAVWYAAADAAVSASRSEGLPFNVMEAQHAGLPVVASAVKGHTDLICHGQNGLLYPFGDEEAFVSAIRQLLLDGELCRSLGGAARESVGQYALERVLPVVMADYLSAAEK